jgi:hypothetical protein
MKDREREGAKDTFIIISQDLQVEWLANTSFNAVELCKRVICLFE